MKSTAPAKLASACVLTLPLVLGGCATKLNLEAPYDEMTFEQALPEADPPKPVEIVEAPKVLPLPGQLKPYPKKGAKEEKLPPEQAIAKANKAARMEPTRTGYINAIQVYPWTEGALYRLYASPEKVSTIALQAGEELIDVSTGDTVRWVVGDTSSGQGSSRRVHILIKPTLPDIQTNLVVLTDRRAYHLELVSTKQTYMASISWTYPTDTLVALHRQNAIAQANEERVADRGVRLDSLNFRYRIEGDDPPWRPVRAFDDGRKVYIQMPSGLSQGEAPPLFVAGADGRPNLVNYRVRGSYYIVDRMFGAAELRLGEDPQRIVRIIRIDARPVSQAVSSGSAS
ncbi:P-type conjugative transfer protein TrbG [Bradyrhizobium elkanii]|uniref:P-type conjugative transfer protein TrbG n=1 Tax=Bradyrhizobium elkanii TaxID=29448 RepID=UPI00084185A1|nr:P-type conjugative transfer protein TrbG [Bradyrhizobium elkanii]ODM79598.1 P-type conjugative transfer protein TrbG [Bradyrhizobium elkanii]ODM81408.1 P-type conjugative transfer protein TrbG [Bradyrhizobium elkanii]